MQNYKYDNTYGIILRTKCEISKAKKLLSSRRSGASFNEAVKTLVNSSVVYKFVGGVHDANGMHDTAVIPEEFSFLHNEYVWIIWDSSSLKFYANYDFQCQWIREMNCIEKLAMFWSEARRDRDFIVLSYSALEGSNPDFEQRYLREINGGPNASPEQLMGTFGLHFVVLLSGITVINATYMPVATTVFQKIWRMRVPKRNVHTEFYKTIIREFYMHNLITEETFERPLFKAILENNYSGISPLKFDPRTVVDCDIEISYGEFLFGVPTRISEEPTKNIPTLPPAVDFYVAAYRIALSLSENPCAEDIGYIFDSLIIRPPATMDDWAHEFALKLREKYVHSGMRIASLLIFALEQWRDTDNVRLTMEFARTVSTCYGTKKTSIDTLLGILVYNIDRFGVEPTSVMYPMDGISDSTVNVEKQRANVALMRIELFRKRPKQMFNIDSLTWSLFAKNFIHGISTSYVLIVPNPNAQIVADLLHLVDPIIRSIDVENFTSVMEELAVSTNAKIIFLPENFEGQFVTESSEDAEFSLAYCGDEYSWFLAKNGAFYSNIPTDLECIKYFDELQIHEFFGVRIVKAKKSRKTKLNQNLHHRVSF